MNSLMFCHQWPILSTSESVLQPSNQSSGKEKQKRQEKKVAGSACTLHNQAISTRVFLYPLEAEAWIESFMCLPPLGTGPLFLQSDRSISYSMNTDDILCRDVLQIWALELFIWKLPTNTFLVFSQNTETGCSDVVTQSELATGTTATLALY